MAFFMIDFFLYHKSLQKRFKEIFKERKLGNFILVKIYVDYRFKTHKSLWTWLKFSEFDKSQIWLNCRFSDNIIISISSYNFEASLKKRPLENNDVAS